MNNWVLISEKIDDGFYAKFAEKKGDFSDEFMQDNLKYWPRFSFGFHWVFRKWTV